MPPTFGSLDHYIDQMLVTIQIAIWGTLLAVLFAIPFGLLSSDNLAPWWINQPVRRLMDACRAINELVFAMLFVVALDVAMMRGARSRGEIQWGKMPARSQYALFILAVTFTWLMGLMGFARSGIRQHWHVYQVMRDTSDSAYIPTHGFATIVVSIIVLFFFLFVSMVFALAMRSEQREQTAK